MSHPVTYEEYEQRSMANTKVTGMYDTTAQVLPCPWCGAPDWLTIPIFKTAIEGYGTITGERTCSECGRSGKLLITEKGSSTISEFVQTGGPDAPTYLNPPPRRID